jgi:hypothetical protein
VEAKAFVQSPLSSDDDEGIVPALAPGDSATFVIGLSAGESALEKAYPVSIDFQYELPDGDTEVSQTYRVPVTVDRPERRGSSFLPITVGALAMTGLGLFVWLRRGRE